MAKQPNDRNDFLKSFGLTPEDLEIERESFGDLLAKIYTSSVVVSQALENIDLSIKLLRDGVDDDDVELVYATIEEGKASALQSQRLLDHFTAKMAEILNIDMGKAIDKERGDGG